MELFHEDVLCTPGLTVLTVLAAALLLQGPALAQEEEKVVNVYNGSDYTAEETIKTFERETGIKVRYVLPMPENAWDLDFKPECMAKLKSCCVSFLDSPTDIIPAARHYLGKPPFTKNQADFQAAPSLLMAVRP